MLCLTLLDGLLVYLSFGIFWLLFSWPMIVVDMKLLKEENPEHVNLCAVIYGFWLVLAWYWYVAHSLKVARNVHLKK